ncbi:hypothetical protein LTR12_016555 [Friedmanniomyces endolithicus]|nr:hypothetical protein LTR74_017000 [Friedmanniomyces endolithicus]KAK1809094.1 hypothetical protein LTR12_016555 [Friedmanniomyces endolithicus]
MTGLTKLPSELISAIVSFLDDADALSTRLTSRNIERASLAQFGSRFFRKKGYLITTPSLDVLSHIAAHKDLKKYVQHVWFNPDCFTFVHPACAPDPQEAPDPENPDSLLQLLSLGDRKRYEAYQVVKQDHSALLQSWGWQLQGVLTPIFAALPNLKTVGMRRSEDHAPWGWRRLKDIVGEDPRDLGPIPSGPMRSLSDPTKLFLAVIVAAAAANVQLRRFYIDAIELDNIHPASLTQETLDKACGSIWYLEINITKAWLYKHQKNEFVPERGNYGSGLTKLLKATTQLKEIALQIFPDRQPTNEQRDAEFWRNSYPYICLQRAVESVQLPHLARVKLEKAVTSPATLLALLSPCAGCLTSLKLRDVRLLSDEEHPQPWRSVFAFLLASCPKLDYLLFSRLLWEHGVVTSLGSSDAQSGRLRGPDTRSLSEIVSASSSGESFFLDDELLELNIFGQEAVARTLEELVERHRYHTWLSEIGSIEERGWHTDTTDEDW